MCLLIYFISSSSCHHLLYIICVLWARNCVLYHSLSFMSVMNLFFIHSMNRILTWTKRYLMSIQIWYFTNVSNCHPGSFVWSNAVGGGKDAGSIPTEIIFSTYILFLRALGKIANKGCIKLVGWKNDKELILQFLYIFLSVTSKPKGLTFFHDVISCIYFPKTHISKWQKTQNVGPNFQTIPSICCWWKISHFFSSRFYEKRSHFFQQQYVSFFPKITHNMHHFFVTFA